MSRLENVQYNVVLVFPGFGPEREYAEQVVEEALNYLNTPNYEPGFRFAPNVTARLELVAAADEAEARLEADDDLAMMILHDLDDEEKAALTAACVAQGVPVCHTVPGRKRARDRKKP